MPEARTGVDGTPAVVTAPGQVVESLFREEAPRLWHAVLAYAGGRRDVADDAVSEAFARLIEHGPRVRKPVPWLYRVALNVAARELKRRVRITSLDGVDTGRTDRVPDDLVAMLGGVSPGQRAALYLHYEADLPVREIARLMGTTAAVVKVHLSRGRARLREQEVRDDG